MHLYLGQTCLQLSDETSVQASTPEWLDLKMGNMEDVWLSFDFFVCFVTNTVFCADSKYVFRFLEKWIVKKLQAFKVYPFDTHDF